MADLLTGAPTIAANQQNAELSHNEAIYRISAVASRVVSDVGVATVPATPTAPLAIILANTHPTYPNHIAYCWQSTPTVEWVYIAPRTGWLFINTSAANTPNPREYYYNGTAWIIQTTPRTIATI